MDFEKNTIIATAAGAAAVIALVTAVATQHSVNKTIRTVNFDQSIDVATAKDNSAAASTEEAAESADAGSTEYSDYSDDVEQTTGVNKSSFNIIEADGMIRIKDSTIRVPAYSSDADDGTSPDDLYVFLPGENTIEYDSTSNYLELNDTTIVRTIAAEDATYEGVCSFKGQDAEDILIGEKKINDNSAIAVIYTVPSTSDNDKTVDLNAEAENVQTILDNTTANAEITSGSLFGYSINPDWLENVVVTNEGCEFIKGESKIYAAPYVGSFADGTTNVLTAGNITLTYSDNIVDDNTGYKPYILSFDEVQDGTVKSDGTLKAKVLSKTNGQIKDFFMAE